MALTKFAGNVNAVEFAFGCSGSSAPALQVLQGSTSTGAYTLLCSPAQLSTSGGAPITLSTSTPITIGSDSGFETVTPSAVSTNNLNQLLITATFTYAHGTGAQVSSGSLGLQEALAYAASQGGGSVTVDARWTKAGGTQTLLGAAVLGLKTSIVDNREGGVAFEQNVVLTAAQINTMFTTPVVLLPAPGATGMYVVDRVTLVNENGGTAWTSGGAITIGYNSTTSPTQALSGTIAATFLTSPTVTQIIQLAGAQLASSAASTYLNQGIYISNATGVFATGTGTVKVRIQYSVLYT